MESNPRAEVTWFKDGEEIVNASTYLIIYKGGERNLNLVYLDEEDFRNYNCLAENKLCMETDSVRIAGLFFMTRYLSIIINNVSQHYIFFNLICMTRTQ